MGDHMKASRRHPGYLAAWAHRVSGLALALFLPAHFLVLGLAIEGEASLNDALRWAEQPLVKFAEWGLLILLSVHLSFGVRLLLVELLEWRGPRLELLPVGLGITAIVAVLFVVLV